MQNQRMILRAAAVAILCAGAARADAPRRDRVALVVENRSSNASAAAEVVPAVADVLRSKGYEVIDRAEVERAIRTAGLTSPIDLTGASKLREALQADAVVTVTISFFLDARDRERGPRANPAFGLGAVVLPAPAAGKAWRNSLGFIADEPAPQKTVFRKAGPKPVAQACERLLWSMPRGRGYEPPQMAKAEEPARPATSTRFEAPLPRLKESKEVARFPLRIRDVPQDVARPVL